MEELTVGVMEWVRVGGSLRAGSSGLAMVFENRYEDLASATASPEDGMLKALGTAVSVSVTMCAVAVALAEVL